MLITEMIKCLEKIRNTRGDIPCWISEKYSHCEIKWIDYSECNTNLGTQAHVCIRIDDDAYHRTDRKT